MRIPAACRSACARPRALTAPRPAASFPRMPHRPLPSLDERFRRGLRGLGLHGTGARVLVALSGGCDSVALLHLLRFHAGDAGITVAAAHFDHAMRPDSEADARWAAGLCRGWGIPFFCERSGEALRTEADARQARYAFLRRAAREWGATHLATAHHADDQAETVLFRALRGTGVAGLAGIAPADGTGLVRPLLPFWRREIARWARGQRLRWRDDPTNRGDGAARNRIRRLLPWLERRVAPGARRSLVRLAALAREEEAAWEAVLAPLLGRAAREEDGAVVLVRGVLAGYDSAVAARLLRAVLRRLGSVPGRAGTRRALQFIIAAPSGRQLRLPGGVLVRTEFGEARIQRVDPAAAAELPDRPLAVPDAGPGEGTALLGGRTVLLRWRAAPWSGAPEPPGAALALAGLRFPLRLRGRAPGDRLRTRAGTRPLKKVLSEARIPRSERGGVPVLADAEGRPLWVAGIAQAEATLPRPGETALFLEILYPNP